MMGKVNDRSMRNVGLGKEKKKKKRIGVSIQNVGSTLQKFFQAFCEGMDNS